MPLFTSLTSMLEDRIDLLRRLGRTRGIGGLMTVEPLLSLEGIAFSQAWTAQITVRCPPCATET